MAGSLGDLLVTLRADIGQFQSDMGKAVRIANSNSRSMEKGFRTAAAGLKAFAGVAVGASIVSIARQSIALGDQLSTLSQKTGIAGQSLSQLKYVADASDVPFESLAGAISKLQRNLAEAGSGNKALAQTFRSLGLSVEDLRAVGADKAIELIASRIAGLQDDAARTQVAVELFGRAGADLLPLLNRGAEGIRNLRSESDALGQTLTNEQIEKLAEADDAIKRLTASWDGFAGTMVSKVGPAIAGVLDYLQQAVSPDIELRLARINKELENAGTAADRGGINALLAERQKLLAQIDQSKVGSGPQRRRNAPTPIFDPAAEAAAKKSAEATQAALKKSEESAARFRDQMAAIREELYTGIPEAAQRTEESIEQAFGTDPYEVKPPKIDLEEFERDAETMGQIFQEKAGGMTVYADEAARNMQDAFADFLFDPFKGGLRGMLTGFVNILRRMVAEAAAAKIFESLGGGAKGGGLLGGLLGSIFGGGKATGGPVSGGMSYLVGEKGPELLTMGRGQSGVITPNNKLAGSGGITVTQHVTYSGLGLSAEQVFLLQQRNNQDLARRISEANRRAGLPAPRF